MKKTVVLLLAAALTTGACSDKGGGTMLASDTDSVAYVIGMNIGMNLHKMDSTINAEAVCAGIRDALNKNTALSVADAETFYLRYVNFALPEKARAFEEQFLQDIIKSNRSYARTASGVAYTVDVLGDQDLIPSSERDTVVVRCLVRTADGKQVYSSYERGDTLRLALRDLVKGAQESIRLIGKGGKINAWMPSSAAYGAEGDEKLGVAPNTTLYYEIELLDVDKYANRPR